MRDGSFSTSDDASAVRGQAVARAPTFVPHGLILDAPHSMLPLALHRTWSGAYRPGLTAGLLAAALRSGAVACDAVALRWAPPHRSAEAHMARHWTGRTGHEGGRHRILRGAAIPLLAASMPGARIEPERTWIANGRSFRVDLAAQSGSRRAIVAEVGAIEGDAILALLLLRPGPQRRISHVVVLPFAGARSARSIDGYAFRLMRTLPLGSHSRTTLRTAWTEVTA